jgi:hypothetical protein
MSGSNRFSLGAIIHALVSRVARDPFTLPRRVQNDRHLPEIGNCQVEGENLPPLQFVRQRVIQVTTKTAF